MTLCSDMRPRHVRDGFLSGAPRAEIYTLCSDMRPRCVRDGFISAAPRAEIYTCDRTMQENATDLALSFGAQLPFF